MTTRDPEAAPAERSGHRLSLRMAPLSGPAAAAALVGGLALAAYVFTPTTSFRWTGDVAQFGELRHYSIALGSVLGLVFLWPVWADATNRVQRAGLCVFGVGLANEAVANGLATAGRHVGDWHVLGLLFLFPVALLVYGAGDAAAGRWLRGAGSLLLGGAYLANVWLSLPPSPTPEGYSLVGYVVSFVLVAVWAVVPYLSLRDTVGRPPREAA